MKNNKSSREIIRKGLLICGILSSVLYIAMNIFIPMMFAGYSSASQTVSELSAIGVPTRTLWVSLGVVYTLLIIAFASGILLIPTHNKKLRITGILILAYGIISLLWPFAPMHQREALAMGQGSFTDILHIVLAVITVCLMLAAVSFGAMSFGRPFGLYSITTIVILILFGIFTFRDSPSMEVNLPTPWIGIWERVSIGAYLVWIVVLNLLLVRNERDISTRKNSLGQAA